MTKYVNYKVEGQDHLVHKAAPWGVIERTLRDMIANSYESQGVYYADGEIAGTWWRSEALRGCTMIAPYKR